MSAALYVRWSMEDAQRAAADGAYALRRGDYCDAVERRAHAERLVVDALRYLLTWRDERASRPARRSA